jgi:ribosome-associated protein
MTTPSIDILLNALDDIKAKNVCILDVKHRTPLFDTVVIASGDSTRQVKALAHNAKTKWKEAGGIVIGMEGEEGSEWIVLDCDSIVVHIMQAPTRDYYRLEELWSPSKASSEKPASLPHDH